MAHIDGWDSVQVFSEDKEKAKRKAVQIKKKRCRDDLDEWNWEECDNYYGAWVIEIKEGLVLIDNRDD
jgi:hypothetical protein